MRESLSRKTNPDVLDTLHCTPGFFIWSEDLHEDHVIEKGPGYVALVAIVIAREGSEKRVEAMRDALDAVEIHADSIDDLAVRVGKYGLGAITSIGDPGPDKYGSPLDVAVSRGATLKEATAGRIVERD